MALTITLEPDVEARFRDEADREGVTLEQLTAQRLLEADLLWHIRTAARNPKHANCIVCSGDERQEH